MRSRVCSVSGLTICSGDAAADVINDLVAVGLPQILEIVQTAILSMNQRTTRPSDSGPWLVHGTRGRISDFFDYTSDNYRGDSVEIFVPADNTLGASVDAILAIFATLRDQGAPPACYFSVRFMAPSQAFLGLAPAWGAPAVAAFEVSFIRRVRGAQQAIQAIQDHAVNSGLLARVHWGQQNDLDGGQVAAMWGTGLATFRQKLAEFENDSPTFENSFTASHGLSPELPGTWAAPWMDLQLVSTSTPSVVSAGNGRPLAVFALDAGHHVIQSLGPTAGAGTVWAAVGTDVFNTGATPIAIRGHSGRVEVFVRDPMQRLAHTWEQDHPGGPWAAYDHALGTPVALATPRVSLDPAVSTHSDGRLEVFVRQYETDTFHLLHVWPTVPDSLWGAYNTLGSLRVGGQVAVAHRVHLDGGHPTDQLVIATTNYDDGTVWFCAQIDAGDSGWNDWSQLRDSAGLAVSAPGGNVLVLAPTGRPIRVVAVSDGSVVEWVDSDRTIAPAFDTWQSLRPPPAGDRIDSRVRMATTENAQGLWLVAATERHHIVAARLQDDVWQDWMIVGTGVTTGIAAGTQADGLAAITARDDIGALRLRTL